MSDGGGFVSLFWLLLILGPVLFAVTTCFAKVTLVLSALRLGISPRGLIPWSIVASLSLLVSLVIMTPTMEAMWPPLQAVWAALAVDMAGRTARQLKRDKIILPVENLVEPSGIEPLPSTP